MERLGLNAKEMFDLSNEIWKTNEEEISKNLKVELSKGKPSEDVLRVLIDVMTQKYTPLVLCHVMEANNVKITSQLQELLKK